MSKKLEYHYYFVNEHLSSLDSQDISAGPRILKMKVGASVPIPENSDGPFLSIRNLKRTSTRFKNYREANNKRSIKICEDRWILEASNHGIIAPLGNGYPKEFIKSIEHATKGKVKNGKVSGVHFFDEKRVRIIEVVNKNDVGVFKARIQLHDYKTDSWYEKEKASTFFPLKWDLSRLFEECSYAYFDYERELVQGLKNTFKSKTKSGIDVRMIIHGNKIKTLYPIL